MHRLLQRQLAKTLDITHCTSVTDAAQQLVARSQSAALDSEFFQSLSRLLERVDAAYNEHDRNLALRERSLSLSSEELMQANLQIRSELAMQQAAVATLQNAANSLLETLGKPTLPDDDSSLTSLTGLLAELVALKQSAERQVSLQQYALDQHAIVSLTDRFGNITYANQKFCAQSGYAEHELLGKNHRIINSHYHSEAFFSQLWQTVLAGKVWHGQLRNLSKSGKIYWVETTIVPFNDTNGVIEQFAVISTDITQQKLLAEQLNTNRKFLQNITDAVGEGIYVVDQHGTLQFLNPEAQRLTGWDIESAQGNLFYQLVKFRPSQCADTPKEQCPLCLAMEHDNVFRSEAGSFANRDAQRFPISLIAQPLKDENGHYIGHVGVFQDISVRKLLEQQSEQARVEAERANQAKSQFLATISHEIRTPMNAILGLTHLALETHLNTTQRDYLEKVQSSANMLLSLVNDLLDLSKVEAGHLELELREFASEDLIADCVLFVEQRARRKGVRLDLDISPTLPSDLIADRLRLSQVLTNLLSNAVKFTETGRVGLTIDWRVLSDDWLELSFAVTDSGIGMNEQQLARLFTPFTQGDASITRRFGGTGLGLTIAQQITRLMGGNIAVTSELGAGSRFAFSIPVQRGVGIKQLGQQQYALPDHVWLTINDATVRELTRKYLQANAIELTVTEQLSASNHAKPLITDDVDMAVRASASQQPVLVIDYQDAKALHLELIRRNCKTASIIHYPFTDKQLLSALADGTTADHHVDSPTTRFHLNDSELVKLRLADITVLLVEDNPISQVVTQQLLAQLNIKMLLAEDGQQAIELVQQQPIDLIIMDDGLPHLSGRETTRLLRSRLQVQVPIIMLSANIQHCDIDQAIAEGFNQCLSKPIIPNDLFQALDDACPYARQYVNFTDFAIELEDDLSLYICELLQLAQQFTILQSNLADQQHSYDLTVFNRIAELIDWSFSAGITSLQHWHNQQLPTSNIADHWHSYLNGLNQQLDAILIKVSRTLIAYQANYAPQNTYQKLQPILLKLADELSHYSVTALDTFKELEQGVFSSKANPEFRELRSLITSYDFIGALAITNQLLDNSK